MCLPKQFLTPCLLLLIDEDPAYGYELHQRVTMLGVNGTDHGTVYRNLNVMESDGLVSSVWERSSSGPRRRRYRVTPEGRQLLADWARSLELAGHLIQGFLSRWRRDGIAPETHVHLNGGAPAGHRGTEGVGAPPR